MTAIQEIKIHLSIHWALCFWPQDSFSQVFHRRQATEEIQADYIISPIV